MKTLWTRWMALVFTVTSCGIILSSSCGRQPIQTLEESVEELTVEGAFADWNSSVNSFAGGVFALLDATTNEVFSGEIKSGAFKIEKVPSNGRYYGMLIGPDYQVRATLQKKLPDNKTIYNVFRLGNSMGQLGTLVINSDVLASSQQSELDFQTTLGASANNNDKKAFTSEYSANFNANPDIDADGTPNMIDPDVDGDEFNNIIDSKSYGGESIEDSKIAWQYNYAHSIPKLGYFNCDQLKSPVAGLPGYSFEFWCALKVPNSLADKVTLKTVGLSVEMADDGGTKVPTHKDPIANDGVWNARFSIDGNKTTLFTRQMILANVTLKNGQTKSYLTLLGPEFPYSLEFNKDATTQKPSITLTKTELKAECIVRKWPKDKPPKGLLLEVILLNEDETYVKSFTSKIESAEEVANDASAGKFTLTDTRISELGLAAEKKFKFKARILGPAALPGLVGSGTETLITDAISITDPNATP